MCIKTMNPQALNDTSSLLKSLLTWEDDAIFFGLSGREASGNVCPALGSLTYGAGLQQENSFH